MYVRKIFQVFLWVAFIAYGLFFSPKIVFGATVVINEFMPHPSSGDDWIELYNQTSQNTAVDNWKIYDSTSTVTTLTGSIDSNGFKVLEVSNRLNNGGDTIIIKDQNDAIIDEYTYSSDPGINYSYGRSTDGIGSWVTFSSSTKGLTNNTATPVPTATLTPTSSPTPTTVPTPTKTPTPAPTSKPSATSTPKPANTATPVPNSPTIATKITTTSAVLGEQTTASPTATISPSKRPDKSKTQRDNTMNIFPLIFMGLGVTCILSCGILVFRAYKKGKIVWHE